MGFKTVIAIIYVVGALAVGAFSALGFAGGNKEASTEVAEVQNEASEGGIAQKQLKEQLSDALDKLSESESEITSLEDELSSLREENEYLSAELISMKEEEEDEEELLHEEPEAKPEEEETIEEDLDMEELAWDDANNTENETPASEPAPETTPAESTASADVSYTYIVNTSSGMLSLYDIPHGGSPVGNIPKGETGEVISLGADTDNRALIVYEGKSYYASKKFLIITTTGEGE